MKNITITLPEEEWRTVVRLINRSVPTKAESDISDSINLAVEVGPTLIMLQAQARDRCLIGCKVAVRTGNGYFGLGSGVREALAKCASVGASGVQQCNITLFLGEPEALKEVEILTNGDLSYPSSVSSHWVGDCKINLSSNKS